MVPLDVSITTNGSDVVISYFIGAFRSTGSDTIYGGMAFSAY